MSLQTAAELLVLLVEIYLAAGVMLALPFVLWGVERIDDGAKGAGIGFRLLILPGACALWPLIVRRFLTSTRVGKSVVPEEHNAHRDHAELRLGP